MLRGCNTGGVVRFSVRRVYTLTQNTPTKNLGTLPKKYVKLHYVYKIIFEVL